MDFFNISSTSAKAVSAVDANNNQPKPSDVTDAALTADVNIPGEMHPMETASAAEVGPSGTTGMANVAQVTDTNPHFPSTDIRLVGAHIAEGNSSSFEEAKSQKKREKRLRQKMRKNLEKLNLQGASTSTAEDQHREAHGTLRKRSDVSTPQSERNPPKKRKTEVQKFSDALKKDLMVYVGPTEGDSPISPEEYQSIKKSLTKSILDRDSGEESVRVESCSHLSGRVRIACADQRSLDWMKTEAKKLVPLPGARQGYWVMGPGDLPPTKKCTAWVPIELAESKEALLDLLKKSNRGLRIEGIHLIREAPRSGRADFPGRLCIFAIEEDSFKQLEALNMRPYCGMGRIKLNCRNQGKAPHVDPTDNSEVDE